MDLETYEQYEIPVETVEEEMKYILENMEVKIQFFGSRSYRCSITNNCRVACRGNTTFNQRCNSYWFR